MKVRLKASSGEKGKGGGCIVLVLMATCHELEFTPAVSPSCEAALMALMDLGRLALTVGTCGSRTDERLCREEGHPALTQPPSGLESIVVLLPQLLIRCQYQKLFRCFHPGLGSVTSQSPSELLLSDLNC